MRVPTSAALAQLLDQVPAERVTLAWLIGRLEERSFGLLMLLLALISLAPGIATFTGFLIAFPAAQMLIGRDAPTLPRILAARSMPAPRIRAWMARAVPLLERMETLIRPRLQTPFQATKRVVGLVVLLLAATLVWPIPLSHVIPALVIVLISFAYLEEDGALLCVGLAAALLSLSISAATAWAALSATEMLGGFLAGL